MKLYEYQGNEYSIKELAIMAGLSYEGMFTRLKTMTVYQAMEKPFKTKCTYDYKGKNCTIKELSEISRLSVNCIMIRLRNPNFKNIEEVVSMPFNSKEHRKSWRKNEY